MAVFVEHAESVPSSYVKAGELVRSCQRPRRRWDWFQISARTSVPFLVRWRGSRLKHACSRAPRPGRRPGRPLPRQPPVLIETAGPLGLAPPVRADQVAPLLELVETWHMMDSAAAGDDGGLADDIGARTGSLSLSPSAVPA
jgi:hypothetical protein